MTEFVSKNRFPIILFILFFPIKTLFYNLVYFVFDFLFTGGLVSENFTYNYQGYLMGCQEIQHVQGILGDKFEWYNNLCVWGLLLMSILAGLFLIKKLTNRDDLVWFDWILLFVFSFGLFESINYFIIFSRDFSAFLSVVDKQTMLIFRYILILFLGFLIFFKYFSVSTRKKIVFLILPSSIISFIVWFFLVGPALLPIYID